MYDGEMLGFGIFFMMIFLVAFFVLYIVFWIWMLADCLGRKFKGENEKLLWALVILFGNIIGASLYYFMVKHKVK